MSERVPTGPQRRRRNGPVIYVVDDEPMLLELTAIVLEPHGYKVECYGSPDAALRAYRAADSPPALMIIDYAMQNMTGLELAAACRKRIPQQKVLLISGTVSQDILQDAPVQPDHFLTKPYQAKQLISAVECVLNR